MKDDQIQRERGVQSWAQKTPVVPVDVESEIENSHEIDDSNRQFHSPIFPNNVYDYK